MFASEDTELRLWLNNALHYGGSFVQSIAEAAYRADESNYAIIRPILLQFKNKYPAYADEKWAI